MPRLKRTGRSKEEEESLRFDGLMEAATQVFLETGYEAANTSEIAKRARASKQTLYSHFSNKEQLFLAVIDRRFSKVSEAFTSLFYENLPLPELLLSIGSRIRAIILDPEHISLLRIVYLESARFPNLTGAFLKSGPEKGVSRFTLFLRKQIEAGALSAPDPRLAAEHFFSLILGDSVNRALLGSPLENPKKADELRLRRSVECFLKAYLPRT